MLLMRMKMMLISKEKVAVMINRVSKAEVMVSMMSLSNAKMPVMRILASNAEMTAMKMTMVILMALEVMMIAMVLTIIRCK